ncbi:hypothetical protein MMC25_000301 [Agyrium rufum]|nr:hypothetical protein [Agyrium rufum]
MPPNITPLPRNKRLAELLYKICPEHVASREEQASQEEAHMSGERNVPLFVVNLAFPSMPTFLHVFEPRYRLLMRRAIETGDRKFGLISYNQRGLPQGDLGVTQFQQYGTLLHINSIQLFPDGRSFVETVGVSRFKVKSYSMLDGYIVANTERVDDVPLAEEEQIEAAEVSTTTPLEAGADISAQLDRLSTRELLQIALVFVARMRSSSASWLRAQVIDVFGPPPQDPALFPYWFASVVPVSEDEKYKLLPTRSVRERLKITARWVKAIESQRWDDSENPWLHCFGGEESSEGEESEDEEHDAATSAPEIQQAALERDTQTISPAPQARQLVEGEEQAQQQAPQPQSQSETPGSILPSATAPTWQWPAAEDEAENNDNNNNDA